MKARSEEQHDLTMHHFLKMDIGEKTTVTTVEEQEAEGVTIEVGLSGVLLISIPHKMIVARRVNVVTSLL